MANVFLSYDHEDVAFARPLAAALEKAGHTVWYDRHIHGGAQYSRKIEQALDAADAVIVLWSTRSLDSAWVRDEAAEGRDRGKLVPLSIEGVNAPMGFRQFQTIDLGTWKGRGKVPHLDDLLEAVASQANERAVAPMPPLDRMPQTKPTISNLRTRLIGAAVVMALLAAGFGAWRWLVRDALPIVEVAAANGSPRSQAAASDLFVKLGSLAQVGEGKWKLVDAASAPSKPTFVFRTADTGSASKPQSNLVLLDGNDDSLLWSREFTFPAGGEADLRQQLSFTAGRVLGCALETREAGGLPRNLFKLFLDTCATIAETGFGDPATIVAPLRTIITAKPGFTPAWGRLVYADTTVIDMAGFGLADKESAIRQLRSDMAKARAIDPDLPELMIGELRLLPPSAYSKRIDLFAKAVERAPNTPQILADQSLAFSQVGRNYDAVESARRAAELDPLSPTLTGNFIMALAHNGQMDAARNELARAERLWAGTGALRDVEWAFHLRYGDPALAKKYAPEGYELAGLYLAARADPSAANVDKLIAYLRKFRPRAGKADWGFGTQAFSEFGHADEAFDWVAQTPTDALAADAYLFFRPGYAPMRNQPRFIALARRIGLVDYWRSGGKWPDFCNDPELPYDCKAEAAKYAS